MEFGFAFATYLGAGEFGFVIKIITAVVLFLIFEIVETKITKKELDNDNV